MLPDEEATARLIGDYFRLFINRVDCHLGWRNGWRKINQPITRELLRRAILEPIAIGTYAVSGIGTSRWICFDADDDIHLARLVEAAAALPHESCLLEPSRRGGHLWLFIESAHWDVAHEFGQIFADQHRLGAIEIFPKYDGYNGVRLPGTVHPKSGERYPVIGLGTGKARQIDRALASIQPMRLPKLAVESSKTGSTPSNEWNGPSCAFDELIAELEQIVPLTIFDEQKARGTCPWHDDTQPSLYIKGRRFHCLACGVFGDVVDVRRWRRSGVRPPGRSSPL